jgi:hypothetical protein
MWHLVSFRLLSMPLGTRAVERLISSSNKHYCAFCGDWIKFEAHRAPSYQVICNVYEGKKWDRTEVFHRPCYDEAGLPHGDLIDD